SAENKWNRAFDSSGGSLLSIDENGTGAAGAGLATIIGEIIADSHTTRRQALLGSDGGDVSKEVVGKLRLAVLHVEAPSGVYPALSDNHACCFRLGNVHVSSDGIRAVFRVDKGVLFHSGHAF